MMIEIQAAQKEFGILDRVPEGVCVLREDFIVLFWNRCLEDWTGILRNDILGKDIGIYYPHLHQPKYAHRLKQVFRGGPPTIFSSQLHKSIIPCQLQDERWRIQHTTVTAVPALASLTSSEINDKSEEIYEAPKIITEPQIDLQALSLTKPKNRQYFYALLVIEDVTDLTQRIQDYRAMRDHALEEINERKKIEEALRESQNFIQKIANATPCIIYIYDLIQHKNIYFNHQVNILLGYTDEEIETMEMQLFFPLIHPEDLAQNSDHLEKLAALEDGGIIEREYRIKHQSGEWHWFHSREIVFTRTAVGSPKQILGTAEDISKRKWAEEAMRLQTERERLMGVITQDIRRSLDLSEILNTTVTEVRNFLQTDRAIIFRFQPFSNSNTIGKGMVTVESVIPVVGSIIGVSIPECCVNYNYYDFYLNGNILSIKDVDNYGYFHFPKCHIDLLKAWGVKADLEVPILQSEQLWGLLMVHHCREIREWQPLEIDLMKQLANQLAIAIQQAELYQQLQAANEQLLRLATSDGLTHLANRRRFDEYLMQQIRIVDREEQPLSLILCDIDFFKCYNDTYGHQAGDECLRLVAKAIQRSVKRPADLVARYGGEEFAVILPKTNLKGGLRVAKEIQIRVKDLGIPHSASEVGEYVTLSVGLACIISTNEITAKELIAATDRALYQAKKLGRDRIVVSSESCLSQL